MNTFDLSLGWLFVAMAAVFSLALVKPFACHFYPGAPGFLRRLAAPVIFVALAAACFRNAAVPALVLIVALGTSQIMLCRWLHWRR